MENDATFALRPPPCGNVSDGRRVESNGRFRSRIKLEEISSYNHSSFGTKNVSGNCQRKIKSCYLPPPKNDTAKIHLSNHAHRPPAAVVPEPLQVENSERNFIMKMPLHDKVEDNPISNWGHETWNARTKSVSGLTDCKVQSPPLWESRSCCIISVNRASENEEAMKCTECTDVIDGSKRSILNATDGISFAEWLESQQFDASVIEEDRDSVADPQIDSCAQSNRLVNLHEISRNSLQQSKKSLVDKTTPITSNVSKLVRASPALLGSIPDTKIIPSNCERSIVQAAHTVPRQLSLSCLDISNNNERLATESEPIVGVKDSQTSIHEDNNFTCPVAPPDRIRSRRTRQGLQQQTISTTATTKRDRLNGRMNISSARFDPGKTIRPDLGKQDSGTLNCASMTILSTDRRSPATPCGKLDCTKREKLPFEQVLDDVTNSFVLEPIIQRQQSLEVNTCALLRGVSKAERLFTSREFSLSEPGKSSGIVHAIDVNNYDERFVTNIGGNEDDNNNHSDIATLYAAEDLFSPDTPSFEIFDVVTSSRQPERASRVETTVQPIDITASATLEIWKELITSAPFVCNDFNSHNDIVRQQKEGMPHHSDKYDADVFGATDDMFSPESTSFDKFDTAYISDTRPRERKDPTSTTISKLNNILDGDASVDALHESESRLLNSAPSKSKQVDKSTHNHGHEKVNGTFNNELNIFALGLSDDIYSPVTTSFETFDNVVDLDECSSRTGKTFSQVRAAMISVFEGNVSATAVYEAWKKLLGSAPYVLNSIVKCDMMTHAMSGKHDRRRGNGPLIDGACDKRSSVARSFEKLRSTLSGHLLSGNNKENEVETHSYNNVALDEGAAAEIVCEIWNRLSSTAPSVLKHLNDGDEGTLHKSADTKEIDYAHPTAYWAANDKFSPATASFDTSDDVVDADVRTRLNMEKYLESWRSSHCSNSVRSRKRGIVSKISQQTF